MSRKLYTVRIFVKISTRRFFRDKTAIFFTILFPLIFLFVFGGIFGKNSSSASFKLALINQSKTSFSKEYVKETKADSKLFKVDNSITTLAQANEKMGRGELDATLVLPPSFGAIQKGETYPSGQAHILYTQNNAQAAQTFESVLQAQLGAINSKLVNTKTPFTVKATQNNERSLSSFDYTFAGLLGFSIIGLGIFGPVNVFPELKKQGILRRLHTTPLRVWQYFLSTMVSQALIGLITMAVMFAVAISVFHLEVVGNYIELAIFLSLGIMMILGVGLAIGGWAKNERQAAPLANIVVFPMMFLSGTFFPRFLMPQWLQHVTTFLPLTPVIDGVRLIATEGKSLVGIDQQLGLIVLWMIVIYAIAFRTFRWE
ncbi:MAG: ABC transporter permease [Candidatus Saccharibacteria bacterium]